MHAHTRRYPGLSLWWLSRVDTTTVTYQTKPHAFLTLTHFSFSIHLILFRVMEDLEHVPRRLDIKQKYAVDGTAVHCKYIFLLQYSFFFFASSIFYMQLHVHCCIYHGILYRSGKFKIANMMQFPFWMMDFYTHQPKIRDGSNMQIFFIIYTAR